MGVQKSSVFVSRQAKEFRAPPQVIPAYVAKNASKRGGVNRIIGQRLIEQDMKARMSSAGSFDVLKGAPLLVGSKTQDFRQKNITKMIEVVERPKPQAVEYKSEIPGNNTFSQPYTVSRILALSNAQVRIPGLSAAGSSEVSGITTEMDAPSTVRLASRGSGSTGSRTASAYSGITDRSSVSGQSVSDMSVASKESASTVASGGTVTNPYVARVLPFNRAEAMERGLPGTSTTIRTDPALRDSFGPQQQQMLAETIRNVNNPIMRTDETFVYAQRQLRSGSTQETGVGSPSLSLERVPVQARGQAGPQLTQPAKAPAPPDDA